MGASVIRVEHIDQNYCRLWADNDVLLQIQETYSFFAKDYKHMPLYKRGIWDGKVRLFNVRDCKLPSGLLYLIRANAHIFNWEVRELAPLDGPLFDDDHFLEKITPLSKFEIMPHQIGAVGDVLTHRRRLVLSPTSSGKSLILYLCSRYIIAKEKKRILIIVPNKTLVEQMREDFTEYSTDGWGGAKDIHAIYAEQEIWVNQDVVVSTYQTAVKLTAEWYKQFGAIFIDEAHGANSKSVSTILDMTGHMYYHAGFTGTLNGTYLHEMEMRARFGDVTKLVTTRELMDMGIVAQLTIDAITYNHGLEVAKGSSKWDYAQEIDYIVNSEDRNVFLANIVASADKNVMILFHYNEHGKKLRELIEARIAGSGRKLYYVDGNVEITARAPIRQAMENAENDVLLASYGTSSVGLSIKNIHTVILGHPFRDRIRVLQTIGRGLRISPTKKAVTVVDVGDLLSGKRKIKNAVYEHFMSRLELYHSEGFDYNTITIGEGL